jgi:hypothetical protein
MKLKDGTKVKDPRLDRLIQFDERSRRFPIKAIVPKKPRSYTWRCNTVLNQGSEGSCVGHGIAHELLARPSEVSPSEVDHRYAKEIIYWGAQQEDEWPGGSYPGAKPFYEGTSVLAGVKVVQAIGWIKEYRWGFSLNDLILGVGHHGPAVLGIAWLEGMSDTDDKGFIHATGSEQGGHCILCRALDVKKEYFTLRNSWGKEWGLAGDCKISFKDMEKLLAMQGEVCFFVDRVSRLK